MPISERIFAGYPKVSEYEATRHNNRSERGRETRVHKEAQVNFRFKYTQEKNKISGAAISVFLCKTMVNYIRQI